MKEEEPNSHPYLEEVKRIFNRFTETDPEWLGLMAQIQESGLDLNIGLAISLDVRSGIYIPENSGKRLPKLLPPVNEDQRFLRSLGIQPD